MRDYLSIIVIYSYFSSFLSGQITTGELILQVLSDDRIQAAGNYIQNLENIRYGTTLVDNIQLRSRTDRLMFARQDFIVRTSFNAFGLDKAEKQKHQALIFRESIVGREYRAALLKDRYMAILDYFNKVEKLKMDVHKMNLLQSLDNLYRENLKAGYEVDLKDYLELKEDILRHQTEMKELERSMLKGRLLLLSDTSQALEVQNMILPESMLTFVETLDFRTADLPQMLELDADLQLLEARRNIRILQDRRILDFAQLRYTLRDDLLPQNRFTIGVGLELPWKAKSQPAYYDYTIKEAELVTQKRVEEETQKEAYRRALEKFRLRYDIYLLYEDLGVDPEFNRLQLLILQSGRMDPLELEELKFRNIDLMYKKWDNYYELLISFIELLDQTGLLSSVPLKNYLQDGMPLLSQN